MNKLLISTLLCATFAMTACQPSNNANNKKTPKIGFSVCCEQGLVTTVDEYVNAVEYVANQRGVTLNKQIANEGHSEQDPAMQFNQIKEMIDNGAKAVIVVFVSDKNAAEHRAKILEYAEQHNVAIIAGRRAIPKNMLIKFKNTYAISVSPEILGMQQGKMVADEWKKHPEWDLNEDKKMSFAMLKGPETAEQALLRVKNAINTIRANPQISSELTVNENSGWKREDAKAVVAKWISAGEIDKVEAIVANSDELALGAVDALREANRPLLPIFGMNTSSAGLEAITNNELIGSVLPDAATMGSLSYQVAENLATKQHIDAMLPANYQFRGSKELNVKPIIVTKENISQYK
ncbi:MAG: substrate-binding domain-containing protein [Neisseriaceae bacterium]|nr:substrate-binding domain-containing protein [Neisseriaceae bacterium]